MEIVKLWIHQSDCPFILTSEDFEVKYCHNLIDINNKTTVKRGYIAAKDPEELQNCLNTLLSKDKILKYLIYERCEKCISMRMDLNFTHAMETLIKNGGYIVGPFIAEKGKETWQIGFDDRNSMENFLDDLFPVDDYTILNHYTLPAVDEMSEILENLDDLIALINTLAKLTPTEKETLIKAIKGGYYEQPKKIDLSELSDVFGTSKVAIYKNLKRAEHKVMEALVKLLLNMSSKESAEKLTKRQQKVIKEVTRFR